MAKRWTVVCFVLAFAATTAIAEQSLNRPGGAKIVKSGEETWVDYPNRPGVKLAMLEGDLAKPGPFLMRVKFPMGYSLAPHTHPGIEHTTILSGSLQLGYGTDPRGASEEMPAGTVLITPPNTPHFFLAKEETIVQTHGVGPWSSTPVAK